MDNRARTLVHLLLSMFAPPILPQKRRSLQFP